MKIIYYELDDYGRIQESSIDTGQKIISPIVKIR